MLLVSRGFIPCLSRNGIGNWITRSHNACRASRRIPDRSCREVSFVQLTRFAPQPDDFGSLRRFRRGDTDGIAPRKKRHFSRARTRGVSFRRANKQTSETAKIDDELTRAIDDTAKTPSSASDISRDALYNEQAYDRSYPRYA